MPKSTNSGPRAPEAHALGVAHPQFVALKKVDCTPNEAHLMQTSDTKARTAGKAFVLPFHEFWRLVITEASSRGMHQTVVKFLSKGPICNQMPRSADRNVAKHTFDSGGTRVLDRGNTPGSIFAYGALGHT